MKIYIVLETVKCGHDVHTETFVEYADAETQYQSLKAMFIARHAKNWRYDERTDLGREKLFVAQTTEGQLQEYSVEIIEKNV